MSFKFHLLNISVLSRVDEEPARASDFALASSFSVTASELLQISSLKVKRRDATYPTISRA